MKSVGLVTSWRENYGSVLQCYATKITVQKLGYYCEVLYEQNKGVEKYKHYLKRAYFLGSRVLCHKGFLNSYKKMKANGHNVGIKISRESLRKLELFAYTVLQPRGCDYKLLQQFAESDEYAGFIAGSDQIWNSHEPANPVCFLSFAPSSKKIALAPSFGANDIADFNQKDFKKLISDFPYLSVREESGEALIESLIGKKVPRLADPSVLFSAKEWRFFANKGKTLDKPYILLHFLDEPSDKALEVINAFQSQTGYQVVILAYPHQKFETIDTAVFFDASPYDYVSLIDNASIVCTDSFHTSLFSISLNSQFYTFARQYKRIVSQSSRIETLLKSYDYQERMIANADSRTVAELLNFTLHDCSCLLETERRKTLNYLINALNKEGDTNKATPKLKDSIDCVGCGACVAICPRGALSFSLDNRYGYSMPILDNTKCVKCGMCEKVCYSENRQTSFSYDKEAYIAYNLDARLRHDSASGGVFSALAKHIIRNHGVVFGAVIDFDTLPVAVHHAKAETLEELQPLLNSKYVQSNCSIIYPEVKLMLETGRTVLFSGTSCQVYALYQYLSGKKYPNLFTVDLICHGVPGERLFREYVGYLENKYHGKIKSFGFRTKDTTDSFYVIFIITLSKNGTDENIEIPLKKSAYYRMFMAGDNYRESCYKCKFSSINKPADITVGDYYEAETDYPELFDGRVDSLNLKDGLSCLLVNTIQGYKLLVDAESTIWKYPVDVETVQKSHLQLCQPQTYSIDRKRYFNLYERKGYLGIERFLKRRDMLNFLPQKIISILKFLDSKARS